MKKIPLALLILGFAMLACSLAPQMPTAGNPAEPFPTEQVSPSPISISTPPISTAKSAPINCTVTAAEALHLRNAPNIEAVVIGWLAHGEILNLSPDLPAGVWVKVTTADNLTGWVNSNFCEVTQ